MVKWSKLWNIGSGQGKHRFVDEARRLLPATAADLPPSSLPAKEVTKVALRLKYQIEQVIPCEVEEDKITRANSPIVTRKVVQCAKEAGETAYRACVVYGLLICKKWFLKQAMLELWDAELHEARAVACEVIAKRIIEGEEDQEYLLLDVLLKRFSIVVDGGETEPANVIERAVDLHALRVIGSSGYQKAVKYLWRGWIVQDDKDAGTFIQYQDRGNSDYWKHFDPDRMRTPLYQNTLQVIISLLYLALYTQAVNSVNADGDLDVVEGVLYVMTLGFICDEIAKFWKIGRYYLSFWNVFNSCLYALLTTSFVIRMVALAHSSDHDDERRAELNTLGYNFFATAAPMFWMRLLLNLDSFRFFGAMLVVLKVMMRESLIFFALLIIVCIGFLQAFIGFNQTMDNSSITVFIVQAMANSVMQSPDFDGFDDYAAPFGIILYYIFTFVVMVILLNILIALYNSAYEDITDNATDEYMALFAQKTMGYVRAPDENVFIAPFNLIEIFFLVLPFEWWMDKNTYGRLNDRVMAVIYSPMLLLTALYEVHEARRVSYNRGRGEEDDDTTEEWEQMAGDCDFEGEGWRKKVESSKPDIETDIDVIEIRELKKQVDELKQMISRLSPEASRDLLQEPSGNTFAI